MPFQSLNLLWGDRSSTPDDYTDVLATLLAQHVHHIGEILVVAALVGAHRHGVRVFLDGRTDDVGYAAVMSEVDDLRAMGLQQPADHVDRGVMAVEQRGGGHESQRTARPLRAQALIRGPWAHIWAGGGAGRWPPPGACVHGGSRPLRPSGSSRIPARPESTHE